MKLQLVQPGLRRSWDLRNEERVLATLRIPLIRRGAEIEIGDQKLAIEPSGLIGTSLAVRDTATGAERTRVARQSLHRVLELNGKRTEWRSLGWSGTYGFVDSDGKPLVSGKVSPGLTRTSGKIEVADDVPHDDALLAAALTAYLLIRKAEDNSSAAAGTVAATGSTG